MCGHGRGNRAPCAGRSICASFAPLGVYIYAFGGESCTTRLTLLRSARQDPDRDRAWHPRVLGPVGGRSSLTPGKSAAPPARCIHHPRHDASSAGYRLLASFAPGVASHEPSPCRSPAFAPSVRRLGPDLLLRRVFVRSFCARRRPVSELNPRQMCRDAIRRYMTLIDSDSLSLYFVRT